MALIFESLSMLAKASARARPASDNSASLLSSAFSAWRTMKTVDWPKELENTRATRKQSSRRRIFINQLYFDYEIRKQNWKQLKRSYCSCRSSACDAITG